MKPLLPRINSYLVPIQFPLSQPLVLQPSMKVPLPVAQGASLSNSETFQSNKRVRIAPKVGFFGSCFLRGFFLWFFLSGVGVFAGLLFAGLDFFFFSFL